MHGNDLAQLPINEFLNTNGLVCVWCTNSQNHIDSLKTVIFPAWKVKYVACWYWIKVLNLICYIYIFFLILLFILQMFSKLIIF